jgi:hypothetical protein
MALRLRRGTNAERLTLDGVANPVPVEGELIYTTDSKKLFVGDGATTGGVAVDTGIVDASSISIGDLSDVSTTGLGNIPTDGEVLGWDGGELSWKPITLSIPADVADLTDNDNLISAGGGVVEGSNYKINIVGQDSTLIIDVDLNKVRATGGIVGDVQGDINSSGNSFFSGTVNLNTATVFLPDSITTDVVGSLTGDANGNHTGTFTGSLNATGVLDGDLIGSVFGDDSTILIDGINKKVLAPVDTTSVNATDSVTAGKIRISPNGIDTGITTYDTADTFLNLTTANTSGYILSSRPVRIGGTASAFSEASITMYNATANAALLNMYTNSDDANSGLLLFNKARGTKLTPTAVQSGDTMGSFMANGYNGANYRVAAGVAVRATGAPQANWIPSSVGMFTSNSTGATTTQFEVNNDGKATFSGPAKLVNYADATARDAAITAPEAGMMVFVTGTSKAQVYDGSAWVDLH